MRERSGEFWSQLRPLLLWNLTLVPALALSFVVTPFIFIPALTPVMFLLVIVGCFAAFAAHLKGVWAFVAEFTVGVMEAGQVSEID